MSSEFYLCSGTTDPQMVSQAFNNLVPVWRSINSDECDRVQGARTAMGPCTSYDGYVRKVHGYWPWSAPTVKAKPPTATLLGQLPSAVLSQEHFLPFFRKVERLAIDERSAPIIVYWSRQTAGRMLPDNTTGFQELTRQSRCLSIFSEEKEEPPDEWVFWMESKGLCLVVYGVQPTDFAP